MPVPLPSERHPDPTPYEVNPMRPTALRRFTTLALLLTVAGSAQSDNFRWLDSSAVRYFTDRDWNLFSETAQKALDTGNDGQRFEWLNPKSKSSGSLMPRAADTAFDGKACRRLEIESQARGVSGKSTHILCRQPDGNWKILR